MSNDDSVASPCVQVCCLDLDDICIGCYRTVEEIREWSLMSVEVKREVIRLTDERYQAKHKRT